MSEPTTLGQALAGVLLVRLFGRPDMMYEIGRIGDSFIATRHTHTRVLGDRTAAVTVDEDVVRNTLGYMICEVVR